MNIAAIEFGSNINPVPNVKKAKTLIKERFKIIKESALLRTKPFGVNNQDDYINCAVLIETEKSIEETKSILNEIEISLGRKKGPDKYASRTIDLDIVVWNNEIVNNDYMEREYVRINIGEIIQGLE
jgi:2-amino-4-hydroxy-6-hydroxymethyldihydropteridine diphosphokinase